MRARVGVAAWGLALASVGLLVASLQGVGLGASMGWSWFILSFLAAGAAAIVLASEEPQPAEGGASP